MLYSQLSILRRQSEDLLQKDEKLRSLQTETDLLGIRLRRAMAKANQGGQRRPSRKTKDRCLKSFLELNNKNNYIVDTVTTTTATKPPPPTTTKAAATATSLPTPPAKENVEEVSKEVVLPPPAPPPLNKKRKRVTTKPSKTSVNNSKQSQQQQQQNNNNKIGKSKAKKQQDQRQVLLQPPQTPQNKQSDILTTEESYYTYVGEEFVKTERDCINAIKASAFEVPQWRILNIPRAYNMEGTENIEDDVFDKRHSKLENDEKRRKRWDIQRIREQRNVERLRARYDSESSSMPINLGKSSSVNSSVNSERTSSILPSPWDVTHIFLSDQIPVSAFGQNLPKLPKTSFALNFKE